MTNSPVPNSSSDAIIRDLHRVREAIVESFGGDLHALAADARRRQAQEGRKVWHSPRSPSSQHVNFARSEESSRNE